MRSEMIGGYVFRRNREHLVMFMELCTAYYNKVADLFTCKNEDGEIVAVAFWNTPEQDLISIGKLIKHGFLLDVLRTAIRAGFMTVKRVVDLLSLDMACYPTEPVCYLFLIGSTVPGAGRHLMNYCIDYYRGNLLCWESAVPKDDHAYYRSFGAQPCGTVKLGGEELMLFVLDTR